VPGAALALSGDVGDAAVVTRQAEEIMARFGRIDGLVTCAGFSNGKTVPDCPLDEWEAVLRTNVTGTFLWAKAAVGAMRAGGQGGAIVMVGSQLAFAGGRGNAAYLTSKGAVTSLARTMAVDHAAEGIRVNLLVPGAIDTPLLRRAFDRAPDPKAAKARSVARHPLGRLGKAEEMARAVAFLLSDAASFTTGSSLVADGGWLAG
ncbi:MAG: SDR family oxidoreductase, partial [Jannaschia sp.]